MPADRPGPLRLAILGIDGSGKSTVARCLAERSPIGGRHAVLSCVRPHENPDAPLHELSRHLDLLSKEADRLHSPELKLAVLYLQMCTYGVSERFFVRELGADVVISERHPVIDALAYLPLYRSAIVRLAGPGRADAVREGLAALPAASVEAATAWCEALGRRSGRPAPRLDTLAGELVALPDRPAAEQIAEFRDRFGIGLPDIAVLLDVDVATAADRIGARDRRAEQHERPDRLTRLRDGYERALPAFGSVTIHRIQVGARPPGDVAAEIARLTAAGTR
ncbi:hypothetical protein [Actinomadura sp. NEAU-AAG7]|uniref:hypothetical protein n=1 Tax=Actinomadura sp. NEAU-AAG7 TaxID=2839640 RepID=UPI001BE44150|nr:hypothetical protein [Actinomadura sp. NEAU-AAG7]MBT2210113.1 hypothetical protein [Actinomadura sp. NEAU-AAG7]